MPTPDVHTEMLQQQRDDLIKSLDLAYVRLAEVEKNYADACTMIREMHRAAVGEQDGPILGLVEDVADIRNERDTLIVQLGEVQLLYADLLVRWQALPKHMTQRHTTTE